MVKGVILSLLVSASASQAAAAPAIVAAPVPSRGAPVTMVRATPRPLHAVLRYDASTTEACRSLSDASSEACLLLALHIIRLSEKPQTRAALELVLAPASGAN
jgi:hypothetical protein